MPTPPLPPGTVLDLAEADYRFGLGPLKLRVVEVFGVERLGDGAWVKVRGTAILWNGTEEGPRDVLVRASAIGRATLAVVKVFVSADGLWRIEQADVTRILSRTTPTGGWALRKTCRTPAEVDAWLREQGDPVTEWRED